MIRRAFLQRVGVIGLGALACAACRSTALAVPAAAPAGGVRAIAFDLFTIFDPRSVERAVEAAFPGRGRELARAWRSRQFEYAFLRAAAAQYVDFRQVTEDALTAAAAAAGLDLSDTLRSQLARAYEELEPWPDSLAVLRELRAAGLRLAPLANYAPAMLRALLDRVQLAPLFEDLISTDRARTFKPAPAAYQLGVTAFGLPREQIAFAAFGGWDAAGAAWFGYPTFWVNRLGVEAERLAPAAAIASGPDLRALANWVARGSA